MVQPFVDLARLLYCFWVFGTTSDNRSISNQPGRFKMLKSLRKGFTLVELMIVVAIIGILAAIAIPNFVEMQYRAKRAEIPSNVDGIKTAQMGYDAAFDEFISCLDHPGAASIGKKQVDWAGGNTDFQKLGWSPDGKVRGTYAVDTTVASASVKGADFTVTGICDVDADSNPADYTATKSINTVFLDNNDTY